MSHEALNSEQFKRYLRVGEPPSSGRSSNYVTGKPEKGISVYDTDEQGRPVVPSEEEWGEESFHDRLTSDDPKYYVTGKEVGKGQGGEPVLRKMKILGHYDPGEHFDPEDLAHWRRLYHGEP